MHTTQPCTNGHRIGDVLTCLAEAPGNALELVIGAREPMRGEAKARAAGDWAWRVTSTGFLCESRETWGGWYTLPTTEATWEEIDAAIDDDRRIPEIRAWSESLTAPDAWRDRSRPTELGPDPMHPDYTTLDHQRDGWTERLHAWTTTLDVLHDAIDRAPTEPEQLDLLEQLTDPTTH